jgi:Domain of unknown function (DUF4145)
MLNSAEGDKSESDKVTERLRENVVTYEYQKHPRNLKVKLVNVHVSTCSNCNSFALWVRDQPVFPGWVEEAPYTLLEGGHEVTQEVQEISEQQADKAAEVLQVAKHVPKPAEEPIEEAGDEIEESAEDFEKAAAILNKSPDGAAALMRICIQNMLPLLKKEGRELDDNISSLVHKGLEVEIQQSMDTLQVLRKTPFQQSYNRFNEDREMATKFVKLLNGILQRRMLKNRELH